MTDQKADGHEVTPFDFTVEEPESWQRIIKVRIAQAHFDSEYARHLRQAARNHVKPGFRKGKVPRATVEKELGDRLRVQTLERVIPDAFKAAIVGAPLTADAEALTVDYDSPSQGRLVMGWDDPLTQDGVPVDVRDYPRYGNPYSESEFRDDVISFSHEGQFLRLGFENRTREVSQFLE